jgi:hypothetical protein
LNANALPNYAASLSPELGDAKTKIVGLMRPQGERRWGRSSIITGGCRKVPKSLLIAMTIELREDGGGPRCESAARERRHADATKVGIQLSLGKTKPAIADKLGLKQSTVADLTRKPYQTLDVHHTAEFSARIWLAQRQPPFN